MRRATLAVTAAVLLAGPTALAFFSGAFFTEPRVIAAIVAWLGVLLLALTGPAPLPRSLPGWLAVGGLVAITAWSAASISWAPQRGPALENVERLVLYVGVLLVAIGVLRSSALSMRAVEPALAGGATIVICYGLSGRLLPGLIHLAHSTHAGGRLEQPITYWNSEGTLAAIGLVLCARLVGDPGRPTWTRSLAAAAAAPLGAGVYLSYSRGAIAAAVVGLVVLVAAVPRRSQLRAVGITVVAGVAAAAISAAFGGVASLDGSLSSRESDGAIVLVLLVVLAAAAAFVTARWAGRQHDESLPGGSRFAKIAAVAVVLVVAGLVVGGLREKVSPTQFARANPSRLTSVSSNRYEYWRVGWKAFVHHPLDGLGAAGFRTYWLRERHIRESVQNVHSIELEMAAELGLVGLLAFGTMVGGIAAAARRALRRNPALAAGWSAGALVWFLHASIDWDWQIPAVTLPALVLAGALIAASEQEPAVEAAPARSAPPATGRAATVAALSSRHGQCQHSS
jgi:O-antigen ligase/polysaccharide polymerase Wzy-like membrane protein